MVLKSKIELGFTVLQNVFSPADLTLAHVLEKVG
jgi:hypothetical protein